MAYNQQKLQFQKTKFFYNERKIFTWSLIFAVYAMLNYAGCHITMMLVKTNFDYCLSGGGQIPLFQLCAISTRIKTLHTTCYTIKLPTK